MLLNRPEKQSVYLVSSLAQFYFGHKSRYLDAVRSSISGVRRKWNVSAIRDRVRCALATGETFEKIPSSVEMSSAVCTPLQFQHRPDLAGPSQTRNESSFS